MIDMLSAHYSPIVAHHRNYLGKYLIDTKVLYYVLQGYVLGGRLRTSARTKYQQVN